MTVLAAEPASMCALTRSHAAEHALSISTCFQSVGTHRTALDVVSRQPFTAHTPRPFAVVQRMTLNSLLCNKIAMLPPFAADARCLSGLGYHAPLCDAAAAATGGGMSAGSAGGC
jgi:hypothetical protein